MILADYINLEGLKPFLNSEFPLAENPIPIIVTFPNWPLYCEQCHVPLDPPAEWEECLAAECEDDR